jgi:hypothetical protein
MLAGLAAYVKNVKPSSALPPRKMVTQQRYKGSGVENQKNLGSLGSTYDLIIQT